MDSGEVNKGHAINYFSAVIQQEFVNAVQQHHNDPEVFAILEKFKNRLDAKLAHGQAFFNLGLNKAQKDGGSYGRYRDREKDLDSLG